MKTKILPNEEVRLHRRDFQRLDKVKRGSTLSCDSGVLWVTQPGDHRDYILLSGDQMEVTKRGKVLVEAMREATLHLN